MIVEKDFKNEKLLDVAKAMLIAARTAPKATGKDNLVMGIAEREDIEKISAKMKEMTEEKGLPDGFIRDANNILSSEVLVLIGTKIRSLGLEFCGLCGFENCGEKKNNPDIPCSFNTGDLGIAVGSAVSVAADNRVDNRVMYTVGMAVKEMGLLGEDVKIIFAIPLSCGSKNPFFDR